MAYSTTSDILKRIRKPDYDKLTLVYAGDGLTSEGIKDEAIATADSIIDSYLQKRIADLPLDAPPKSIVQASCDIAIYNLHSRIQYIDIPEWVSVRYNAAISWLRDISRGVAEIETGGLAEAETESGGVDYENERDSLFTSSTF